MNKIVYIADLDQDIDDIIAVEYLNRRGVLGTVVLDPIPKDGDGVKRLDILRKRGIEISDTIPDGTKLIFVGGALTAVAKYISNHKGIEALVMNGGFVGSNIVPAKYQLNKFKGKEFVRTFNFNMDVESTDQVLRSSTEQIGEIFLVGKNVCHDDRNTKHGLWNSGVARQILDEYHVKDFKKQHDMLACREGLVLNGVLTGFFGDTLCEYAYVRPVTKNGLEGNMTQWGSTRKSNGSPYRMVVSAINYKAWVERD